MLRYFQDISNFPVVVPPSHPPPLPPPPPPPYKGWELKETEDSSPSTCIDSQGGVFNSSGSSSLSVFSFMFRRIFWCGVIIAKTIFGSCLFLIIMYNLEKSKLLFFQHETNSQRRVNEDTRLRHHFRWAASFFQDFPSASGLCGVPLVGACAQPAGVVVAGWLPATTITMTITKPWRNETAAKKETVLRSQA